LVNGR